MYMSDRYQRNILVEGVGEEGQAKLTASKALVIGAGGLGSPTLYYLAAAGVGTIGIVDNDVVHTSNLQRQTLHFSNDVGRLKTVSAQRKLTALNPEVKILTYTERFSEENAEKIISGYDFVVDCSDNFSTKLLINDSCIQAGKPYSHGAVVALRGDVMTCIPGSSCYRCLFETLPIEDLKPTASQEGILGSVAGIVGSIQATETIKYLAGINDLITNRIQFIDAKTMRFFSINIKKNDACICAHPELLIINY